MPEPEILWPAVFDPARCPVHVVNRLDVTAPADAVWARLIRAAAWPDWYANAARVNIEGSGPDLFAGARFTWRTFGVWRGWGGWFFQVGWSGGISGGWRVWAGEDRRDLIGVPPCPCARPVFRPMP